MRILKFFIAVLPVYFYMDRAAMAGPFGVVGNNVEMYADEVVCQNFQCISTFPINNTGRIVRLDEIKCLLLAPPTTLISSAVFGPRISPSDPTLLKLGFFDTLQPYNVTPAPQIITTTLAASTGMFIGPNRYLTVSLSISAAANQNTKLQCSGWGVFAQ